MKLGRRGYTAVLIGRNAAQLATTAERLNRAGLQAIAVPFDVSSGDAETLIADIEDSVGALDVLINNAAIDLQIEVDLPLSRTPLEVLQVTFATNLFGALGLLQAALPRMNARGYGRIVNVTSAMACVGWPGVEAPAYRLSKATLNAVTRLAAVECRRGVLVNAISPGWCRTRMGGATAPRSALAGAQSILWGVDLPEDGPNGRVFQDGVELE
jgi:NAD(P)-dependent dehydrogenase (short-subunit alcohol dehydrogenase family)